MLIKIDKLLLVDESKIQYIELKKKTIEIVLDDAYMVGCFPFMWQTQRCIKVKFDTEDDAYRVFLKFPLNLK